MPALPIPPPPDREWTPEEQTHLQDLLVELAEPIFSPQGISASAITALTHLLTTPKGVKRYHKATDFALEQDGEKLDYAAWIHKILLGFQQYHPLIAGSTETSEGLQPALLPLLTRIVNAYYQRIFHRYPTPDRREIIIGRVLLSLSESYFYDTALEPWLWRTTRNILRNEMRDVVNDVTVSLDAIPLDHTPVESRDITSQYILHERIREAIRKVNNQRYRVILLLLYIYQLDNGDLASFFGVSVSQATTWISRARKALRQANQMDDNEDDFESSADDNR